MGQQIPDKIRGLKAAIALLGVYVAIWIPLEGNLFQVVLLGVWVAVVTAVYLAQEYLGGRTFTWTTWLGVTAVGGLFTGFNSAFFTLLFMVMKTGLHDHGPEFSRSEINWVLQHLPVCTAAGFLAGLGLGLLTLRRVNET